MKTFYQDKKEVKVIFISTDIKERADIVEISKKTVPAKVNFYIVDDEIEPEKFDFKNTKPDGIGEYVAPPAPIIPHEILVKDAQGKKDARLKASQDILNRLINFITFDIDKDENEKKLEEMKVYYQDLKAVDPEKAPDIDWPIMPNV